MVCLAAGLAACGGKTDLRTDGDGAGPCAPPIGIASPTGPSCFTDAVLEMEEAFRCAPPRMDCDALHAYLVTGPELCELRPGFSPPVLPEPMLMWEWNPNLGCEAVTVYDWTQGCGDAGDLVLESVVSGDPPVSHPISVLPGVPCTRGAHDLATGVVHTATLSRDDGTDLIHVTQFSVEVISTGDDGRPARAEVRVFDTGFRAR